MKVNYKTCIYHYPFKHITSELQCKPPDAHKPIPIECEKCEGHYLNFQNRKTLDRVGKAILAGYWLPSKELPEFENLVILFPTVQLEHLFQSKYQQILYQCKWEEGIEKEVAFRTKMEIDTEVRRQCKENGIDPDTASEVISTKLLLNVIKQSFDELMQKWDRKSSLVEPINEILIHLKEKVIQQDKIAKKMDLQQAFGKPLEEHAHELALMHSYYQRCRRADPDSGKPPMQLEHYWPSFEAMFNSLSGRQISIIDKTIQTMNRWTNMDFFRRLSTLALNG